MAVSNAENPWFRRVEFGKGNSPAVIITSGEATAAANVIIDVGTPGTDVEYGSIYVCNSTGTMFIASPAGNTWFKVTVS